MNNLDKACNMSSRQNADLLAERDELVACAESGNRKYRHEHDQQQQAFHRTVGRIKGTRSRRARKGEQMTLTESFQTRADATAHAQAQQLAYKGARVLVSSVPGGFTVTTSLPTGE